VRKRRELLEGKSIPFCEAKGYAMLSHLDVDVLRTFRASWPYSPLSARKRLEYLRSFFRFCHDAGWIDRNSAMAVKGSAQLANGFGITLTVAHYPTGASKWNPIEHRLSSEISKNWAGEPLDSYQKILRFIRSTRTQTGLAVTAHLDRRHYQTGIEPTPEQLQGLRLRVGEVLPKWNYTISPVL
jgi:hypothetical protein